MRLDALQVLGVDRLGALLRAPASAGTWLDDLEQMMLRRREPLPLNGADQAAEFILSIL